MARRQSIYERAEDVLADQCLMLPFFHEQVYRFAGPDLSEFEISFSKPVVPYEKIQGPLD